MEFSTPGRINSIVLKVASRCNLNCSYCYMYNHEDQGYRQQPARISNDVFAALLARIAEYCDRRPGHRMRIGFHGGEPLLLGAPRFSELAALAHSELGDKLELITMQTNATLLTPAWLHAIRDFDVHVGVSLDGPPEIHDATRVDHQGRGSHDRTLAGLRALREAGRDPGILCVVNPGASGADVYRYFRSIGVQRMDFLLPDVGHDRKDLWYGGLGLTPVADYLLPVLDAWLEEDDPLVRIRFFEDLLHRILGNSSFSEAFGNGGIGYVVVDTDGAIQPNDALRVCKDGLVGTGLNVMSHGFDDLKDGLPILHRFVHEGFDLPVACRGCPEQDVCGGGSLPHRYSNTRGFDNPSVWCADILLILAELRQRVASDDAATVMEPVETRIGG